MPSPTTLVLIYFLCLKLEVVLLPGWIWIVLYIVSILDVWYRTERRERK